MVDAFEAKSGQMLYLNSDCEDKKQKLLK